ncbi:4Fe-4S dicluster domain-containing protein [Limisphaera ngatamarikiensis]|uniref:4Fe-4S dicluster domain-containing protein n=1 Tax=Limisphaera ngatamarikiensis TaxID=1324935 RepID=A0A6M1RKM0_9BACT|nr:4Fe-4S dicluster domain-containing protein [Limisphaera ngatamarikiensis]NGO38203.1 4Fe-4S dicluster domain-containing protein [Limisphaera ngatamarikiensis]
MEQILRRPEAETERQYGVRPHIRDVRPRPGVEFAYALNLTRCIGCRKCAHACLRENNQSREDPDDIEMSYIRVLELQKGAINLETSNVYYDPDRVPQPDKYYMPVQCQQCRQSPCTKVCPVQATWQEPDGIVVVDYNWCIGCRYCMAACPYDARRFNYKKPTLPPGAMNPNQSYLSNLSKASAEQVQRTAGCPPLAVHRAQTCGMVGGGLRGFYGARVFGASERRGVFGRRLPTRGRRGAGRVGPMIIRRGCRIVARAPRGAAELRVFQWPFG